MKTNRELLAHVGPDDLLFGLERQRRYVLRIESARKACPNCATPMTAWEGRGIADVDDYDLSEHHGDEGKCVKCERDIRFILPLIGEWHWALIPVNLETAA